MLSFKQFFVEQVSQSELSAITDWREKAVKGFEEMESINNLIEAGEGRNLNLDRKLNEVMNKVGNHMKTISNIAFTKLQRFHELEYKLHLLETQYNRDEVRNLIDFTKHELLTLYPWLEIVIRTVLESRLAVFNEPEWKKRVGRYEKIITKSNDDIYKRTWDNIYASYALLNKANTLSDKIKAITVSLNAAHDSSKLFIHTPKYAKGAKVPDYKYHSNDDGWVFGPFSIEQYDKLNYIDSNKIKREISREIG